MSQVRPRFRFLLAGLLGLCGTNIITYAATRTFTTSDVLERAKLATTVFLEQEEYFPAPGRGTPSAERVIKGKELFHDVVEAGGMYYWSNDALPYYGVGVLFIIAGAGLPLLTPSQSREP